MRKQFLTAAVVAAVMALGASSASATSLPHSDLDSGNWAAVTVNDEASGLSCDLLPCEFQSADTDWRWQSNPSSPYQFWADICRDSTIAGVIGSDGAVTIDQATIGNTSTNMFCPFNEAGDLPWDGRMCAHIPTGEVWLRQDITLDPSSGSNKTGTTFGEITGNVYLDVYLSIQALNFDNTDSGLHHVANDQNFIHDAEFEIGQGSIQVVTPEEPETAPCGWTELGA